MTWAWLKCVTFGAWGSIQPLLDCIARLAKLNPKRPHRLRITTLSYDI
jgi:hypothetical protein